MVSGRIYDETTQRESLLGLEGVSVQVRTLDLAIEAEGAIYERYTGRCRGTIRQGWYCGVARREGPLPICDDYRLYI